MYFGNTTDDLDFTKGLKKGARILDNIWFILLRIYFLYIYRFTALVDHAGRGSLYFLLSCLRHF